MSAIEIVTKEDLQQLKQDLLAEMQKLLQTGTAQPERRWLKTYDVRKMLGDL